MSIVSLSNLSLVALILLIRSLDLLGYTDDVERQLDSLRTEYDTVEADTSKYLILLQICETIRAQDNSAAVAPLEELLSLAEKIGDESYIARTKQMIGANYLNLGDSELAYDYVIEAKDYYLEQRDREYLGQSLNNTALLFQRINRYEDAIKAYHDVISFSDDIDDPPGKVYALINLISLAKDQKDERRALDYVGDIEDIVKDTASMSEIYKYEILGLFSPIYLNAGLCYKDLNVFDTAYISLDRALGSLEYVGSDFAKDYYKGYILNSRGETLNKEAEYLANNREVSSSTIKDLNSEALGFYQEAFKIFEDYSLEREQTFSLVNQGKAQNALGIYNQAYDNLTQGLSKAKALDFKEQIRDAYNELAFNAEKTGDLGNAITYLKQWRFYSDSIRNTERDNQLMAEKARFGLLETEKKLAQEEAQRRAAENEVLKQESIKTRNNFIFSIIILTGLGLAYAFMARLRFNKQREISRYQAEMNKAMDKFVPMAFINAIGSEKITDVKLGDQSEKDVTVVFTDIRNFTTISENMTPSANFAFVQEYAGRMGPIIERYNGFISQYLGDGIMAIFQDDPTDALLACIEMQRDIEEYNKLLTERGRNPIKVGMGMHTGPLVMGIIGDEKRWDATLISDTVNTAARLEKATKAINAPILISEQSKRGIKMTNKFELIHRGQTRVKGKNEPIEIYECA